MAIADLRQWRHMSSNQRSRKILSISLLTFLSMFILSARCIGQSRQNAETRNAPQGIAYSGGTRLTNRNNLKNYKGENGVLSVKTLVLGGEFRVTTVIPFKGNIADYNRLEITKPTSLVGRALTEDVSNRQANKIRSQFESKKIFDSVTVIDSYNPTIDDRAQKQLPIAFCEPHRLQDDALEAPIGDVKDMEARDKQRTLDQQESEEPSNRTLVTVIEVLDYAKGSRLKQALPLDLGKSILTVRLRYYDKSTGQEIGRQIISGQSDGSSLLGPLSPRDALSGVADGFVDQVTRRVAASEK